MRYPLFRSGRARRGGFSLIEVMVAMLILAIALGSMAALSISSATIMSQNQNKAAASNLAEFKLEELRNATFEALAAGSDGSTLNSSGTSGGNNAIFSRSWTINNDVPVAGMKEIVVTVTWSQQGRSNTYTLRGVRGQ